jgi:tetratricopeptide (TPR) repeat protein
MTTFWLLVTLHGAVALLGGLTGSFDGRENFWAILLGAGAMFYGYQSWGDAEKKEKEEEWKKECGTYAEEWQEDEEDCDYEEDVKIEKLLKRIQSEESLSRQNTLAPKTERMSSAEWRNKAIKIQDANCFLNHTLRWTITLPEDPDAWNNLGIAYADSNQFDKAIEAYQQAISIAPGHFKAWNNLGSAYSRSSQLDKAIDAYKQAIRINPELADTWNLLGVLYKDSNQFNKAIEAYQQAIRINPGHTFAWNNLGIAYAYSNQFNDKAIEAFQQDIRINPERADTWYVLGALYKDSNQLDKAIDVYEHLKSLDPCLADRLKTNLYPLNTVD